MKFVRVLLHWIQASRLPSQLYIFLPLAIGQVVVYRSLNWNIENFILLTLYGFFIQLFIIYANDYADQDTDSLNENYTMFSGGSRVLVDGKLKPHHLKIASYTMAIFSFLISMFLAIKGLYFSPAFWLGSVLLLWMYSYPPFKLSYRGGGEFLQVIGLSLILPLFGYYISSGRVLDFPWFILCILIPTQLACAICTSLPDQDSDSLSQKKTITVKFGADLGKFSIILLQCISLILAHVYDLGIFYISWLSLILSIVWLDGKPGSKRLSLFVFFQLLVTLSLELQLIVTYLTQ